MPSLLVEAPKRPNRSAAARREQRLRAEARTAQRLMKGFSLLQNHRGCKLSVLGAALQTALKSPAQQPGESAPAPLCRHFSRGTCTWGAECRFSHVDPSHAPTRCSSATWNPYAQPFVPANADVHIGGSGEGTFEHDVPAAPAMRAVSPPPPELPAVPTSTMSTQRPLATSSSMPQLRRLRCKQPDPRRASSQGDSGDRHWASVHGRVPTPPPSPRPTAMVRSHSSRPSSGRTRRSRSRQHEHRDGSADSMLSSPLSVTQPVTGTQPATMDAFNVSQARMPQTLDPNETLQPNAPPVIQPALADMLSPSTPETEAARLGLAALLGRLADMQEAATATVSTIARMQQPP